MKCFLLLVCLVFFALAVASSAVVPTDIVIQLQTTSDGLFCFSAQLVGESVPPLSLNLIHTTFDLLRERRYNASLLNITTVTNEHLTAPNCVFGVPGTPEDFIPIGFDSPFSTDFAMSYMMIPSSNQFVINPANPRDFVYGGFLATTRSTSDELPQVRGSVSLLNTIIAPNSEYMRYASSGRTDDFIIETACTFDIVPMFIIDTLIDEIERRGYDVNDRRVFWIFEVVGNLTEGIMDTFPIIQYRIHTDSGEDAIIQLHGQDYLGPLVDNRRELLFRCAGDTYSFGSNTLSKIALFIDNRNKTIGFGDPL